MTLFGGGYDAYLAEREVARRHAREAFEDYADRRDALSERARTQRNWMEHGVRNARRKATDNDKIGRKFRAESTEKQAAKARQTERMIERLDEVAEPRKEWELRMASRPHRAPARSSACSIRPSCAAGGFTFGPVSAQIDWADRVVDHRARTARARPRCSGRCSGGCRWTRAGPGSGRAWSWARSTRRVRCSPRAR